MQKAAVFGLLTLALSLGACVESDTTRESTASGRQIDPNALVGMRGSSLDAEMASSGFENTGGYKTDAASMTTWWNTAAHQCISVETRQGRVAKAETIAEGNCQTAPSAGASARRSESPAEWSCKSAVADKLGIADPNSIRVIGSEASQAGTSVRVSAPGAQAPWSCVIDTDGSVSRVEYTAEG